MCSEPMFEVKIEAPMTTQPGIAAGEEVIHGVLLIASVPPGHPADEDEVEGDDDPVEVLSLLVGGSWFSSAAREHSEIPGSIVELRITAELTAGR